MCVLCVRIMWTKKEKVLFCLVLSVSGKTMPINQMHFGPTDRHVDVVDCRGQMMRIEALSLLPRLLLRVSGLLSVCRRSSFSRIPFLSSFPLSPMLRPNAIVAVSVVIRFCPLQEALLHRKSILLMVCLCVGVGVCVTNNVLFSVYLSIFLKDRGGDFYRQVRPFFNLEFDSIVPARMTKSSAATPPSVIVHTVSAPRYGAGRVTPDLHRTFATVYSKPLSPTMYFDQGRTVQLNIKRLPTPSVQRDYRASILLGGHRSYSDMQEHQSSAQRLKEQAGGGLSDAELLARKLEEQQRFALEFDIAVHREQLLDKQRDEHKGTSANNGAALQLLNTTTNAVSSSYMEIIDGPPPPQPRRVMTPAQRTRKTLRTFQERAQTPDTSFESMYKAPTTFTVHGEKSKKHEEYEALAEERLPVVQTRASTAGGISRCGLNTPLPGAPNSRALSRSSCRSLYGLTGTETKGLRENSPDGAEAIKHEVEAFEHRRAVAAEEEAEFSPEIREIIRQTQSPPPPKLILMMFRFGNVRNLPITQKLREVGYAVLHEQFTAATERGCITRVQYLNVVRRYAAPSEINDALKILNCFDKSATGDVDINHFLLGCQILLHCASAGDTLKYCFSLMDTNSRVPRYVTRFEVQSLLNSALNVRKEKQAENARLALPAQVEEEEGDKEFDIMAHAIHEMMEESWRYDYMGRLDLRQFLKLLKEKVTAWKDQLWTAPIGSPRAGSPDRPAVLLDAMGLGTSSQQQPCVAAAHRMSSKKMLYSSLRFQPGNALKDPHRIPAPVVQAKDSSNHIFTPEASSRNLLGAAAEQAEHKTVFPPRRTSTMRLHVNR